MNLEQVTQCGMFVWPAARTQAHSNSSGVRALISKLRALLAIVLMLLMNVSANGDDPITIKLEGTAIDTLPDSVQMYVAKPHEAADELVKKGGRRMEASKNGENTSKDWVMYRRVDYVFGMPEKLAPEDSNHQFKLGDTVYVFNLESQPEADALVKRYALEKSGTILFKHKTKALYAAKPSYFVFLPVKATIYFCPMHPEQESEVKGNCPICGMPLSPTIGFR